LNGDPRLDIQRVRAVVATVAGVLLPLPRQCAHPCNSGERQLKLNAAQTGFFQRLIASNVNSRSFIGAL
jgi:hypothetical protein